MHIPQPPYYSSCCPPAATDLVVFVIVVIIVVVILIITKSRDDSFVATAVFLIAIVDVWGPDQHQHQAVQVAHVD